MMFSVFFEILLFALLFAYKKTLHFGVQGVWGVGGAVVLRLERVHDLE